MSRFLSGEPVAVGRRGWRQGWRRTYRFREGALIEHGPIGSRETSFIPPDFAFDNSAPWWIAWLIPAEVKRRMLRGCGLHDYLRTRLDWSLADGDGDFMAVIGHDRVREPFLTLCWWAVRTNKNR